MVEIYAWVDEFAKSDAPQDSDIAAQAVKVATHFGDFSDFAAYGVALPHNTILGRFRCVVLRVA